MNFLSLKNLKKPQKLSKNIKNLVVFEKDGRVGGILRYGIPDFKLEKRIIDRRIEQLIAEGVKLQSGVNVGLRLAPPRREASGDSTAGYALACVASNHANIVLARGGL